MRAESTSHILDDEFVGTAQNVPPTATVLDKIVNLRLQLTFFSSQSKKVKHYSVLTQNIKKPSTESGKNRIFGFMIYMYFDAAPSTNVSMLTSVSGPKRLC